jgi:hypothetical protein
MSAARIGSSIACQTFGTTSAVAVRGRQQRNAEPPEAESPAATTVGGLQEAFAAIRSPPLRANLNGGRGFFAGKLGGAC